MPHNRPVCMEIDSHNEERLLEAVRQQHGLATLDQAAEFLTRRRLRKGARKVAGPRAMYPVK